MTCWRNDSGSNFVDMTFWGNTPCASISDPADTVVPCCYERDQCLSNSICHFDNRAEPNRSPYYLAGCTDGTLQDPTCRGECSDRPQPDVIYNATTALWQCCGTNSTGAVDCEHPNGKIFKGPAPDALTDFSISTLSNPSQSSTTSRLPSSSSSSTAAISSTTPLTSTSTPIPSSPTSLTQPATSVAGLTPASSTPSSSSDLTTGAKAGISIGVIIGVGIIALLSALLYLSHKKRRDLQAGAASDLKGEKQELDPKNYPPQQGFVPPQELYQDADRTHEMPGQRWESELDPSAALYEVPGTTGRGG